MRVSAANPVNDQPAHEPQDLPEVRVIRSLIYSVLFFLIATFPATWLLMLFFGNVGLHLSYWGTLPIGVLASVLLAGATSPKVTMVRA
jgi:hypothetical protein